MILLFFFLFLVDDYSEMNQQLELGCFVNLKTNNLLNDDPENQPKVSLLPRINLLSQLDRLHGKKNG